MTQHFRIAAADPEDAAAVACLSAYYALLIDRCADITPADFPYPDPEAALYRPPQGTFLLAWSEGRPVACAALKSVDLHTGEVKRLWVDPIARGQGVAKQMMAAIEQAARARGITRLRLDTNSALIEAVALYRATGWSDVAAFTNYPATHWFGKSL